MFLHSPEFKFLLIYLKRDLSLTRSFGYVCYLSTSSAIDTLAALVFGEVSSCDTVGLYSLQRVVLLLFIWLFFSDGFSHGFLALVMVKMFLVKMFFLIIS